MAAFESPYYTIIYNAGAGIITPTGSHSNASDSFILADGTYNIGDSVTVAVFRDGNFLTNLPMTIEAYTSDGWVGLDGGTYRYFTNTVPTTSIPIPITTTGTFVTCFLEGTLIAAPDGERPVESLSIGDIVLTASGELRAVRWVGRQTVLACFADRARSYPVRIAAGALDENVPTRDLYLSPDHALLIDGMLVHASALVNGSSITQVERPDARFTYFHIELDDHAIVLAHGTPAETFVDNVTRRRFDNFAEYETLYGTEIIAIPELAAPRVHSARQLPPQIRERLAARAQPAAVAVAA